MVCKEDLCMWFKNLSPHKRIDFMCGMLHMCFPMELRFIGSIVEDLAKKDFNHLRESEGKANNRQQLEKLNVKDGKTFRTKIAIYLALLHSSNRTCSNVIFQMLENNLKDAFTVTDSMNEKTKHTILLVLSMAMNHPGFSYIQKTKMYEYYNLAREAAETILRKPEPEFPLILSKSCEARSCDQIVSPACSIRVSSHAAHIPVSTGKVHVCNIEVKGSRKRDSEKKTVEYRLQVTWSNGERKDVYKKTQELLDFHQKLIQEFPEESSLHQESLKLPVNQGLQKKESTDLLNIYTRSLFSLPGHVLQCRFFESFFESSIQTHPPVQMTDASTSPRPQFVPNIPTVNHTQGTVGEVCGLSPNSPAHHELALHSSHSPSGSTKTRSSLISSPCHSPVSSLESPSNSRSTSPVACELEVNSVSALLKSNGLHMLTDVLAEYTLEQLAQMRCEDIETIGIGVAKEQAIAVKSLVDTKAREKTVRVPPNGLIEPERAVLWPPHPYIPPPTVQFYPHMPPPMFQQVFNFPVCHNIPNPGVPDASPTNSDYSSPSPSPHLPMTSALKKQLPLPLTDSSSDDGERDKHPGQHKVNGKWKTLSKQEKHNDETKNESNCNSGTPPLTNDKSDTNVFSGNYGNGYASDPTYNAPRPLIHTSYKAQPTHTHTGLSQKFIINMPESSYLPGAQRFLPQHFRDVTMTTTTGNLGYSMSAMEAGQRLMYFPNGSAVLNRPHFNHMNGSRPIYANGVVTSNPAVNQANVQHTAVNSNSSSKAYQGAPVIAPQVPPPPGTTGAGASVCLNGNDNNVQNQPQSNVELCAAHRASVVSHTSTASSSSVTYTPASQSVPSTSRASCTSCGCTGHQQAPSTFPYMPNQMPHNMWHTPYSNGLLPMPVQPMYLHHPTYPNGLNEHLFNHSYGLANSANHGMATGMPNVVYGYNYCNNHNTNGGYMKKLKKMNCHNCGSAKHVAAECTEVSMEAMSGNVMYSYKNDSD